MAVEFVNFLDYAGGWQVAVDYYYSKWGGAFDRKFLEDAVEHSVTGGIGLPRFYLMLRGEKILGCGALVTNDLISRHDLWPWLAGLYVEEEERGQRLGAAMQDHLCGVARRMDYSKVYLTTDLDGYYEKNGWERMEDGYEFSGEATRIYFKALGREFRRG